MSQYTSVSSKIWAQTAHDIVFQNCLFKKNPTMKSTENWIIAYV